MNIIITTVGTWGDILPYIAIGTALRKRGHDVVLLANSKFESDIRKSGLEYHSIGSKDELEHALLYILNEGLVWEKKNRKTAKLDKVVEACRSISLFATRPIYEYVSQHYQPGNTLLINNFICYGTRYVQDKLGIPGITVVLVPFYFRSKYRPAEQPGLSPGVPKLIKRLFTFIFEDLFIFKPVFEQYRDTEIDLSKYKNFKLKYSPDKVICMSPEWFAKPQTDWPSQTEVLDFPFYEGEQTQELPRELEEFLEAGEPPIIFNPGSQVRKEDDTFVKESINACVKLGKRGIFVAIPDERIPANLPPSMRAFGYVNLTALLPRSAVMVYHGGIGNCAQGLKAGIPHLVVPVYAEHFDTGYRLKELGVGDTIIWDRYRTQEIVNKLDYLVNSKEVAKNCKEYAGKFKSSDPISDFCDIAEKLAKKHGIVI